MYLMADTSTGFTINVDQTIDGSIAGTGSMTVGGSSLLNLTGDSSTFARTTIVTGHLAVNGSLGSTGLSLIPNSASSYVIA